MSEQRPITLATQTSPDREVVMPNPYVGPRTFTTQQAHLFFGREREARELLALVIAERLVLFYAQSGAGKSSLLQTRLIPQLTEKAHYLTLPVGRIGGELPTGITAVDNIYLFNLYGKLHQQTDDLSAFAHMNLTDFMAGLRTPDGEHYFYDPDVAQRAAARKASGQLPSPQPPHVLIIDQFEELITTHPTRWAEREEFFRQLNDAMQNDPYLWVVLTLREDFVAALDPYAHLVPGNMRTRYYMQRMGVEAALDAVQKPATLAGRPFAAGVAEALVDNLRRIKVVDQTGEQLGQYIEPVQLQVVCYQLWESLRAATNEGQRPAATTASVPVNREPDQPVLPSNITEDDLKRLARGGNLAQFVDQALADYYEQALQKVLTTPKQILNESQLRLWFSTQLITKAGTRGFVLEEAVTTAGLPNSAVHLLQDQFLVRAETRAGGVWYELIHDRFVAPILDANRDWAAQNQNPLTLAAQTWLKANKPATQLYRASQLAEAVAQLEQTPDQFGDLEREFVNAGQQADAQRKARRQRILTTAAVLALVVLVGLTTWALWSANKAKVSEREAKQQTEIAIAAQATAVSAQNDARRDAGLARSAQLANQALFVPEAVPERALLLAIEAVTVTRAFSGVHSVAAEQTLRDAISQRKSAVLRGFQGAVDKVTFSPDGHWLAGGSTKGQLRVWNALNPENVVELATDSPGIPASDIADLTFSPDNQWLAAIISKTVYLWQVQAIEDRSNNSASSNLSDQSSANRSSPNQLPVTTSLESPEAVIDIAFSSDSHRIAMAGSDHTIRVWSMQDLNSEPMVLQGHEDEVVALAFSADGRWLASGSKDHTIRLWNTENFTTTALVLSGHTGEVTHVRFSPDSQWLATASADQTIRLWRIEGVKIQSINLKSFSEVTAIAFSQDQRWFASADNRGKIYRWHMDNLASEPEQWTAHSGPISSLAFSPDSHWLVSADPGPNGDMPRDPDHMPRHDYLISDKSIRLWDMTNLAAQSIKLTGHEGDVLSVAFSPDGRYLASGSVDSTMRLWDINKVQGYMNEPLILSSSRLVEYSPDGRWLATSGIDLRDARNPTKILRELSSPFLTEDSISFSPDSKKLAVTSFEDIVEIWSLDDLESVQLKPVTLTVDSYLSTVSFSPDSQWLVRVEDDKVRLWKVKDPSVAPLQIEIQHSPNNRLHGVAFSPDGNWLASVSDQTVELWPIGKPLSASVTISQSESLRVSQSGGTWIEFSPDGKWLASPGINNTVNVWDVNNLLNVKNSPVDPIVLRGHEAGALVVRFSPDSHYLATGSDDKTIRIWNLENITDDPIILRGHEEGIQAISFSADGRWLASTSGDRTTRIWNLDQDALTTLACHAVGRNFTFNEWSQYFHGQAYRQTCPNFPIHQSVVQSFITKAIDLASSGEITAAVTAYQAAFKLDPKLTIDPQPLIEEAVSLASSGEIMAAVTAYQAALKLDPKLTIDPQQQANHLYALALVEKAADLASSGEITAAVTAYQAAFKLDPKLTIDPQPLIEEATSLASSGEITAAVTAYQAALKLDPKLTIDPQPLIEKATSLASSGEITAAVTAYQAALKLDPKLTIDPQQEANRHYTLAQAVDLASNGDITASLAAISAVQQIAPQIAIPADTWNSICWNGSLNHQADRVLDACDKAVAAAPDDGDIRDSRGLARALTGDLKGALEDFEFAVQWAKKEGEPETDFIKVHQSWIDALNKGKNPIDETTLAKLRGE